MTLRSAATKRLLQPTAIMAVAVGLSHRAARRRPIKKEEKVGPPNPGD